MAKSDSALLAIASLGPVESHADVSSRLHAIEAELDPSDGLIWFNRAYAAMNDAVIEAAERHRFDEPMVVERLDCHFADLYFVALASHLSDPGSGPGAWEPLFGNRARADVTPVQFALAGLNAHINRDLPVALVTTLLEKGHAPERDTPVHGDYQHASVILEASLREAATKWRAPGREDAGPAPVLVDAAFEMWCMKRAREAAWVTAEVRWALRTSPVISRHHLEVLDRMVGLTGRGLLRPAPPAAPERRRSSSPGRPASEPTAR
jgi:hypothetical protein